MDYPDTPTYRQSTDEVFPELSPSHLLLSHKRSESVSTTFSEQEFKREYITRRKCLIQRKQSSREYHRLSAKVYGSPAEKAGIQVGQIIVAINGMNVLTASHDAIINAMNSNPKSVCIEVATSDFLPSRDLQASVVEGYMHKLGGSSLMRLWKKRYFVLRQDSCLYYYKHQEEADPLGAIPLIGYSISRHLDTGRDYCFKAEKYGARTYYFMTESRDEMTQWVIALVDAAARCKKRKESFLSVSSHNVGLPALEVRRPECSGYLQKVGNRHKTWRRRYCILKDACLYYYKSMNSLSALGVAHLHGYKVDGQVSVGKKHAFALIPPETNLRIFHFSAENDTDRQRWVEAMIRSIQRWIQVDNTC
ncbi:hypothetical protein C0Q70_08136 [Pomacea canaliculata]|uniref:PH domain-containing protein n=1 Tax=Pomacea canaliculata TaxID=400727 RepID=A0A2T7PGZ9_POMCA|nr:hypothetical protein C0Q70_08136 [Pomacea canaliculata]